MPRQTPSRKRKDVVTLADLAPRGPVVGGSERRVFGADPFGPPQEDTMAGTKKAAKDLAAKSAKVKGGRLSANDNLTLVRAAKPAKKDLAPKSSKPVKGGRIGVNDNLTLVRAAKPAKKDLPAGTDVKAGKKAAR